ncbi:MAG: glycosyltransferase [Acidimicrobiia bacterium]|nr:glycosyltransferase [Acidimicrobiia bacterium]
MATNRKPEISIGLPVYNGENYLAEAIRSLQDQTFGDFEIIVSDNASQDATEEIARDLAAGDDRIRYSRNERNLGANPNYNRTFALAKGTYFRWHAHDDVCDPKYLEICREVLANDPSVSLVHTRTAYIDRLGNPLLKLSRGYLDCDGFLENLVTDEDAAAQLSSALPEKRLDAIVNRMSVFFDIFGLMRHDDVCRTLLLPNYYGADKVFLADMAMQGRLVRLPEEAFARRCHPAASTRQTSLAALASWSNSARRFDFYPALIMTGYVNAVRSSDLSAAEKARCFAVIAKRFKSPYKVIRGR